MRNNFAALLALTFVLVVAVSIEGAFAQTSLAEVRVTPSAASPRVGESFTVNITISNVENLYGIDATLSWNTSVLQATNVDIRLGVDSHPDGVLYEVSNAQITVVDNTTTQSIGEYHLAAFSNNPAPSFNGSGTIAVVTFNVTSVGRSDLTIQSELADHPLAGEEESNYIEHTDIGSYVETAVIPEFPEIAVLVVMVALITCALVIAKKMQKKTSLMR